MARGSVKKRCQCPPREDGRSCSKPHGSWYFIVDAGVDPASKKRRQVKRGRYKTRDEAEQAMTEELRALDAGTWVDDKRVTLGEYLDQWLSGLRVEVRTMTGYRRHVAWWKGQLGDIRLRDLRRHHVEEALRRLGQPVEEPIRGRVRQRSGSTIDSYRRTLRTALSDARRDQLVADNWAAGDLRSIPASRPRELTIWEPEQTAAFLDATAEHPLHTLFVVAAFAGLRRQELLGARWADLDDDSGGITIRQTLVDPGRHEIPDDLRTCAVCGREHRGLLFKATKSTAGDRWVPLVGQAKAAVKAHRKVQAAEKLRHGQLYADHGLIFALPDGDPRLPSDVTKAHASAVKAQRLPKVTLHDMRHGACSILLAGGVPVDVVQMILGHSSPEVTRRIYAHVLRGETARQAERASKLVTRHRAR